MQKTNEATAASMPLDRSNEHTSQYAEACVEVAKALGLTCVDLHTVMQQTPVSCGATHVQASVGRSGGHCLSGLVQLN